MELYQNPTASISEDLIEQISLFHHRSEGLSKHVPTFLEALSLLQPKAQTSLLLTPLFTNEVNVVNYLRYAHSLNSFFIQCCVNSYDLTIYSKVGSCP